MLTNTGVGVNIIMRWIADGNGLCLYVTITDEQLSRIKSDAFYYKDELFLQEIENSVGENCHVIGIYGSDALSRILFHHRALLNKYKTVTWWNKTKTKFKERVRICHQ